MYLHFTTFEDIRIKLMVKIPYINIFNHLLKLEGLEDKYYTVEKDKIIVTKGRGGYVVDTDALVDRMAELITAGNYAESIECPLTYGDVDLDLIYDEVYVEPV